MLYLIGGVTRSGKTTLRHALQREQAVPGATTDTVRDNLARSRPHWGINPTAEPRRDMALLEPHIAAFLRDRLHAGEDFVLEGDALDPSTAAKFVTAGGAKCVFLIYPEIDASGKFAQLRSENGGWIARVTDARLHAVIEAAIKDSEYLRDQCLAFGIPFIDTSRLDMPAVISAGLKILRGDR